MGFADAAKAKQLADALERSKKATRRTSNASTDNSQLTSSPPTVYRLGPMNIPDDLEGMTKLVHSELQKIEQSQSVILSIWEKINSGTDPGAGTVTSVNGIGPDSAGDVEINVGVLTVNGIEPDSSGDVEIGADDNYALIAPFQIDKLSGYTIDNPFGDGVPCRVQVEVSPDDGVTWYAPYFINATDSTGQGTVAAWVNDKIYVATGSACVLHTDSMHYGSLPFVATEDSSSYASGLCRIHCWR